MLRTKPEVDRHVAKAFVKLRTDREKSYRGFSIGRLYFDIGEYETCVRYLTQYLTVKDNNAAAHSLLGQAYNKLGRKEEALSEFKTSLELDPNQNNLLLKVCELLSEESVNADAGCMRYWVDRAGNAFPRHPTLFRLCERLLQTEHADCSTVTSLLREQVAARPLDPPSHARLLRHLLQCKRVGDAFNHAYTTHLPSNVAFNNSYLWLDAVIEVIDSYKLEALNGTNAQIWNYWLLCLTVLERKTYLLLGWSTTLIDAVNALRNFDTALYEASHCQKLESSSSILKHFGGQLSLHGGTLILKKAVHEQYGWREATRAATPLFLLAYQTESVQTQNRDLSASWPTISAHRKSQAGHTLLAISKDKKQLSLDNISQYFSEKSWRDKVHKELFGNKEQSKPTQSYILNSKSFFEPKLKLPSLGIELQQADLSSRVFMAESLHLQTWIGMNFDKLSKVSSLDTEDVPSHIDNITNCGPETLCKFDVDAFLYCTVLIAQKTTEMSRKPNFCKLDRPSVLPAILTEPLCSAEQAKWWEYVERLAKRDSNAQIADLRPTLIRGIETVRCVATHGLDPYILTALGKIFSQRAEVDVNQKTALIERAALYYQTALHLLEQLRERITCHQPKKRIFSFTSPDISTERTDTLIEETKLFLGDYYMNNNDNSKAISILSGVKSPYAAFYLFKIHLKLADEEVNFQKENVTSEMRFKRFNLLSKARKYIYITSEKLKESSADSRHPLSSVLHEHIENVEMLLSSVDLDANISKNLSEAEYLSDHQSSVEDNHHHDSTPIKYQRAPHISSTSSSVKAQLRELKKKDHISESVLQQITILVESNKMLAEQVQEFKVALNDMKSQHSESVSDKRKFVNYVDDIRSKVDELREENIINTMDVKREITDLRKELEKLKISPGTSQRHDDAELLLLEESYRNNSAALSYLPRMPGANPAIPTHPFTLYPPNLYPLYAGQYPPVPQLFPTQVFPPEQALYSELLVPPQVPPTQPVQQAIHDYHIPLPTQTQLVPPSVLNSQTTSTPNKSIFDNLRYNNAAGVKPFNLFDPPKSNATPTVDASKPTIFDTPTAAFKFTKDRPVENTSLNKSRTLSEKSNESYDPLPDYRPMVPLPDEIVPTTGEEDEAIIFDARAKLFRFVTGEWKERGLGQLKLLKNENDKVRLLMRRDTVHTVCANHIITPEMELSPMKGTDKAYFWVANDFADEAVKLEKLCVRFKTVEVGKKFFEMFNNSKNNAISTSEPTAPETTVTTKTDSFVASQPNQTATSSVGGFTFTAAPTFKVIKDPVSSTPSTTVDTTKPNPFAGFSFAKSPNSSAPSAISASVNSPIIATAPTVKPVQDVDKNVTASGWGDKFKPKVGSWDCKACYINNDASNDYCVACDSPKDPGMPKKEKKVEFDGPKFTFGIPAATPVIPAATVTTIATTETPKSTFKFGFDIQTTAPPSFSFGTPQTVKSPAKNDNQPIVLGSMENTKYEFAFTPKPSVPKSPNKSFNESANDNDNDVTQEEDDSHIFFEPVIPMPDKVDVKTGEEDEEVLYIHRSKLFRFAEAEWKECGVGDIKILRHNVTKKIRVLMRREPIFKICLNHYLTDDIEYMPKDEKTWLFSACDFSTGEICPQQFCIRFVNKDVAGEFKAAIDNAKTLSTGGEALLSTPKEEIQFISESQVTDGEVEDARKLLLPDKFYSYKNLPPCNGCRGCDNEDACFNVDPETMSSVDKPPALDFGFALPKTPANSIFSDTSTPNFRSNMIFGTKAQSPFNGSTTTQTQSIFGNTIEGKSALESLLKSSQPSNISSVIMTNINNQKNVSMIPTSNIGTTFNSYSGIFGSSGGFGALNSTTNSPGLIGTKPENLIKDETKNNVPKQNIFSFPSKEVSVISKQLGDGNQSTLFKPVVSSSNKIDSNKSSIVESKDDVEFVAESHVTNEELLKARKLMLPDKFYAYKTLPQCSGCRGCDKDEEHNTGALTKLNVQMQGNKEASKVSTGAFNFSNFSIQKTTTQSIFGGVSNFASVTTSAIIPTANPPVFSTGATPAFGGGMLFGPNSQVSFNSAPVFGAADTKKPIPFETLVKKDAPVNVFGGISGANSLLAATNPVAVADNKKTEAVTTTPSLFGGFLAANSNIFGNDVNKPAGDATNQSLNFWANKSSFTFGKPLMETKAIDLSKSYNDVSDDEQPSNDDGDNIYFKPAIPLPDEVEVKTGEELEEVLYSHRSKLYRFASSEWKECGLGDVKILHHFETNRLRVLMRREPIMKVCLNHMLTDDIVYSVKDEKSWLFSACDFSTGEITPQQFCIRFLNKDIAQEFLNAINDARAKYPDSTDDTLDVQADEEKTIESVEEEKTVSESNGTPGNTQDSAAKALVAAPKLTLSNTFTSPISQVPKTETVTVNTTPVFGITSSISQVPKTETVTVNTMPVFGMQKHSIFSNLMTSNTPLSTVFGSTVLNSSNNITFENIAKEAAVDRKAPETWPATEDFFTLAAKQDDPVIKPSNISKEIKSFTWEGAGTPLFSSASKTPSKNDTSEDGTTEEHDPHFNPIVPLPDKIEVVTGEEDEVVEYNQRCKLFRYSNNEWRERGTGELKILHHPQRFSFRMLLRQEQVHKVVLNQLITTELDLMPMTNSPKAFMWVGLNYTDDEKGVVEKLAVRFRTEDIAASFKSKVDSILEKLPEEIVVTGVSPAEFIEAYQGHGGEEDDSDDEETDDHSHYDYDYDDTP
ncbi:ranBP2-like and GRIP domain-containing protein 3 [Arctopsyche grandis]|uniref:ranBP2-like and GRIP domain-containing protein 3 n=1 Tax=Arctopsyche grandis TaxID=121162 RepID=UPI00406D7D10